MPHPLRVVIPENPGELFKLIVSIHKKDQELGSKSPLVVMESEYTIAELGPQAVEALELQEEIETTELRLKGLYGKR